MKLLKYIRDGVQYQEIVLVSFLLGLSLLFIPFQHYMSLSRYQHYTFVVFAVGVGFMLQAISSWQQISKWGRTALVASAAYWFVFAITVFSNPWMDSNDSMQTELQTEFRHQLAVDFAIGAIPLAFFWAKWAIDKGRLQAAERLASGNSESDKVSK